jgi:tRNA threonylcarbamoyladenosine modification (KEOPS) complex  Pcc1 subunit
MFFLEVKLDFDSKEQALRFFKSIKPELEEEYLRSKMKITQNKEKLAVFVSAQDKTALRASLNSLLKPLVLFESIEKLGN